MEKLPLNNTNPLYPQSSGSNNFHSVNFDVYFVNLFDRVFYMTIFLYKPLSHGCETINGR